MHNADNSNVLYWLHIWNITIQYPLSSQEIYCIPTAFAALEMAYVCGKESHIFIRLRKNVFCDNFIATVEGHKSLNYFYG